jgi:glycosyltransferase involved in cell wall biosynthesis
MISVIIPSYNSERTIEKCLDSIEGQSYDGGYEVILVDSSADKTGDIVSAKYDKVKLIHLEEKTDPGTARNIGMREAKGGIYAFIILIVWPRPTGLRESPMPTILNIES